MTVHVTPVNQLRGVEAQSPSMNPTHTVTTCLQGDGTNCHIVIRPLTANDRDAAGIVLY